MTQSSIITKTDRFRALSYLYYSGGGVAVLAIGGFWTWVMNWSTDGTFDYVSTATGSGLVVLALILYFAHARFAKRTLPDLDLHPIKSFFRASDQSKTAGDPKYAVGNSFDISATVVVKNGRESSNIRRVQLFGFDQGLQLLPTTQRVYLDGELIDDIGSSSDNERTHVCQDHTSDGNYWFTPPIPFQPLEEKQLKVKRHFGPPFRNRGAPIDFKDAELKLVVDFSVDGVEITKNYLFGTNYETNELRKIDALQEISYLTNREIIFLTKKGVISNSQRDELLTYPPEHRFRALESADTPDQIARKWNIPMSVYNLLLELKEKRKVYKFDPESVWKTKFGRLIRGLTTFLNRDKKDLRS